MGHLYAENYTNLRKDSGRSDNTDKVELSVDISSVNAPNTDLKKHLDPHLTSHAGWNETVITRHGPRQQGRPDNIPLPVNGRGNLETETRT